MELFVVVAETGEYMEYAEYPVVVYASRELAEAHAVAAGEWYDERWDDDRWLELSEELADECPYCSVRSDYTGMTFRVDELEMRDALPVAE